MLRRITVILFAFGAAAWFAAWYFSDQHVGLSLSVVFLCAAVLVSEED